MCSTVESMESPIELLRQLIEESGRWTKDLVRFTRTLLISFLVLQPLFVYAYTRSVLNYLSEEGPAFPVVVGIPLAVYMAWAIRVLYRQYKVQTHRRERWLHKFEVLKRKEEEIERLLAEGAG